jgi:hypothetical protein
MRRIYGDRVLAATGRLREVAERFEVSQAYVCRVRARRWPPSPTRRFGSCASGRRTCGIQVGTTTMHKGLGPTEADAQKTLRAAEQARPDVAQAREEWAAGQPSLPAGRLIFSMRPGPRRTFETGECPKITTTYLRSACTQAPTLPLETSCNKL